MGVQDEWSGAFRLPNQARIHTICLSRSCQHGMVGLGSFLKLLILLPKWECALEWGPEAVDQGGAARSAGDGMVRQDLQGAGFVRDLACRVFGGRLVYERPLPPCSGNTFSVLTDILTWQGWQGWQGVALPAHGHVEN